MGPGTARYPLDTSRRSEESKTFEEDLHRKIIGQDEAIRAVSDAYAVFMSGLCTKGRPVGNFMFLGPTGVGKTRVVEAVAENLMGDSLAVVKIDCAEFQHSHEIAKIIGSPPGYLGHRETHPLITQESLAQFHTEKLKLSFLLFDEIEKASDALWQLLLGVLDKATLTLGDNRKVDLSQTMIFMTSNLGGKDITELMTSSLGFSGVKQPQDKLDTKVDKTAVGAARKKFSPEFMNRIDRVVVFRTLQEEQLKQVLELELDMVQARIMRAEKGRFYMGVEKNAKAYLLKEGTDLQYGARHLKRTIERLVIYPLANLLSSGQLEFGDMVVIDYKEGDENLTFVKYGDILI